MTVFDCLSSLEMSLQQFSSDDRKQKAHFFKRQLITTALFTLITANPIVHFISQSNGNLKAGNVLGLGLGLGLGVGVGFSVNGRVEATSSINRPIDSISCSCETEIQSV